MQPSFVFGAVLLVVVTMASICSTPISTREQGGLIGAGVGAGAGGSTVGHAAAAR
jgi:hypothetical protein